MKKSKMLFHKMYGQQLPIRQRFFNIIFTCGFIVGLAGIFTCVNLGSSSEAVMVSVTMTIAMPLLAFIGIKSKKHQDDITALAVMIINFCIFPALYLTGGGILCGIPSYFALGLALTLFLIGGKKGIILTAVEALYYEAVFYVSYAYPQFLVDVPAFAEGELGQKNFTFSAIASNTAMVSLAIGILAKVVFNMYKKENKVVSDSIEEVKRQASIDPLTGLYNRRYMYSYLTEKVTDARKNNSDLCTVLFDIDKFKNLNDTYGHLLGDDVLKAVSKAIQETCKNDEIVARYGGEEFLLILPNVNTDQALERAEQIRKVIETTRLSPELPEDKPVTISGGLAHLEPSQTEEKLVAVADENLYKAKETGRNRICM